MALGAELIGQLDYLGDWGVLATDAGLRVTGWNRWLAQRTGLTSAAVLGKPLFELFPDLPARRLDRFYRQVLKGQAVVLSQRLHQYVLPIAPTAPVAGLEFMQQTVRIIPVGDGPTAGGTVTLIEDVTERVSYEAELRARARRQAAIAVLARAALAGGELEEIARGVVAHVRETLGVEFAEVVEGVPDGPWVLLAGSGWPRPRSAVFDPAAPRLRTDVSTGAVVLTDDLGDEHLRAAGATSGVVVRVPGQSGRPPRRLAAYARGRRPFPPDEIEFIGALADVLGMAAERKHLEEELRLRVGDLAAADRRKDDFLAMLAHELRNPLAPIRNGIQILRIAGSQPDVVIQTREMIDRQVKHLSRLVDDLLDVSRITRGKVELRMESVDLAEVAAQAVEEAMPNIDARRHRLTVSHQGGPVRITADPARLTQILGNLLTNAAKYTDEGGEISLTTGTDGREAVCRVRDNGTGISAAMLSRVFELFTQVDGTLDRAQGGLGIGLTLVKSLVELHGGRVEAYSDGIGKGSEFVVRVPVRPNDAAPPPTEDLAQLTIPPQRILVVDDNVDSAESLATLLRLGGHDVRTAHTGTTAIEVAAALRPGVVLLDIGLPGLNGYEVATLLRARDETRPALMVAMTGYGQDTDRRRSLDAGFDEHLVKPVDPQVLRRLMVERHGIGSRP